MISPDKHVKLAPMKPTTSTLPPHLPAPSPALSADDQEALTDLYIRGTPANTLRAYERDLLYITAWKTARFGTAFGLARKCSHGAGLYS